MNFKKRVNGSWVDTPHYIHNTSTDTITTLPAVLYPNAVTATVGLKGNMEQSGSPTPQTPIQPQECGERTGNLFDGELKQGSVAESSSVGTGYDDVTDYQSTKRVVTSNPVVCHGATVTWNNSKYWICICYFDKDLGYIGNTSQGFETWITTGTHEMHKYPYAAIAVRRTDNADFTPEDTSDLNLVVDNYKIPILSGGVTTPVYLGEVQTTRRIKKLMFDGAENVSYNARNDTLERWVVTIPTANGTTIPENVICTHFKTVNATAKPLSEGGICMRSTGNDVVVGGIYTDIGITAPSDSTTIVNAVKAYLTQQYSAGTPVCVWYVLATPQTAVVNEPLRKIGTYADEVSGITIPTIAGENAVDVLTTLKPSEVTATYKGWHPIVNGHESESGQWD